MVYTPMMYGPGMSEDARESRKNRSLLKTEGTGWDVSVPSNLTADLANSASLCNRSPLRYAFLLAMKRGG